MVFERPLLGRVSRLKTGVDPKSDRSFVLRRIDAADHDRIVFLIYASEGGGLASEADHIDTIKQATVYAKTLNGYLWQVSERIDVMRAQGSEHDR
jgi:hypothetical protein